MRIYLWNLIVLSLSLSTFAFAQAASLEVTSEAPQADLVQSSESLRKNVEKINQSCTSDENVVTSLHGNPYLSVCPKIERGSVQCTPVPPLSEGLASLVEVPCDSLRPSSGLSLNSDSEQTKNYCACLQNPACQPTLSRLRQQPSWNGDHNRNISTARDNPKILPMKRLFENYQSRFVRSYNLLNSRREARGQPRINYPASCEPAGPTGITSRIFQLSRQNGFSDSNACNGASCASTENLLLHTIAEILPRNRSQSAVGQATGLIASSPEHLENAILNSASFFVAGTKTQFYGMGSDAYVSCLPQMGAESVMMFIPTSENQKRYAKEKYPSQISLLSSFVSAAGSCQNASNFKRLFEAQRRELQPSMSDAFGMVPEAWMLVSVLKGGSDEVALQACQQMTSFMRKHVQILEASLEIANSQGSSGSRVQETIGRINSLKNEMHAAINLTPEAEDSVIKSWDVLCNDIVTDAVKIGCSSSSLLISSYDEVEQLASKTPGFANGRTNDQLFCERFPTGENQSSGFPVFSNTINRRSEGRRQAVVEQICGAIDSPTGFNVFLRNGACRGQDNIRRCVQELESSNRMENIQREYSLVRTNSAAGHAGGPAEEEAAAALAYVSNNTDLGMPAGERKAALASFKSSETTANSRLGEIGSIFGGLGDVTSQSIKSVSSALNSAASSLFNSATVQAFGAQARISPITSTAVMNRFIAAVPPMQNMAPAEQRQQMDQALERSVNQTVAELENKAAGTTSASERQKYLDEIAELRRLMADQTARNDLITQQMAAMNQAPAEETQAAPTKRKRAPASVANTSPESPEVQSTGFQTGGGRSSGASASSGSVGGSQDLAGAQGFGGGTAAAGRSVSSVSEARDAAPNDSSLRLVVGGAGGQVIPAAQVITISVPSGDEQALKDAILGQRERLNVGEDGYAVVEVIDPASGRASLVRVKIENDNVIVQNFTAEQLRNTTIVSEANPQPRQIRYSLQAMTNLLNQASGGSN